MKKLLVVLMAAMMVLSMAAVSMAAATVEGDWRWEWVMDESATDDELGFAKNDLRMNFKGQVSDSISAYMQYEFFKPEFKEYYVTMNQSWGKVQAGKWDNKLIPSRVTMKPHGFNARKENMAWLFDVNAGDAITVGLWLIPDLGKDKMDYDLKFAYKADSFGVEVHYGIHEAAKDANYTAFDVYYNVTSDIKAFVYGINASDEYLVAKQAGKEWEDNMAPVIGATWKNIAGSKLTASLEYGLEENDKDFTEMHMQFKYGFTNKINLEVEYQTVNEDDAKLIIRPRVKF